MHIRIGVGIGVSGIGTVLMSNMETLTNGLTDEQVAFYEENGYLVVPDLVSATEIEAFLRHVDGGAEPVLDLQGHRRDPQYHALATHPKIVGMVRQLLGGQPRIVQTMLLDKPPVVGKGIALHQDQHYLPHDPQTPDTLMACWVALTDTDAENGGLCVVPGSQKAGLLSVHRSQNREEHQDFEQEYEMRDRGGKAWTEQMYRFEIDNLAPESIARLTVPRGAGVFFTGRTIHGSFGNHSPSRPRRAFATHYVREDTFLLRCDVQDTFAVDA